MPYAYLLTICITAVVLAFLGVLAVLAHAMGK